jgi:hypothetical protein
MKRSTARTQQRQTKRTRKADAELAGKKKRQTKSVYARKLRGEYPAGSPYAPGRGWSHLAPVRHVNAGGYLHLAQGYR